jgi:hypothetical protein
VLVLGLTLVQRAVAGDTDPYLTAMKRATSLERSGQPGRAAAALDAVAARYQQDFALWLRLGSLRRKAGQHARAEQAYRHALELAPRSRQAVEGLEAALRARRKSELRLSPSVDVTAQAFQNHPWRAASLSSTFSLPVQKEHLWARLAYRIGGYWLSSWEDNLTQHEAFSSIGLLYPSFGVVGHHAYLRNDGLGGDGHVVGLSARLGNRYGDLMLQPSISLYDGLTVARLESGWRLPVLPWLSLYTGIAAQAVSATATNGEVLVAGVASLTLQGKLGSLWLGAKYGDEVRPAYLDLTTVYNIPERIGWGLWAGGRLFAHEGIGLSVSYLLQALQPEWDSASYGYQHQLTLGFSWDLPR